VLNGIAYNPADGRIYLTGKNWPRLYEINLIETK
jgi:glutamine cyclotransferase